MIEKIVEERLAALTAEANAILADKERLIKQIQEFEIRLHQIVGSIHELNQLKAMADVEAKGPSSPTPSEG